MKNKKKKLNSLKSTLVLLQQLQAKYYQSTELKIDIDISHNSDIEVWVKTQYSCEGFKFFAPDRFFFGEYEYKRLLEYLNTRL